MSQIERNRDFKGVWIPKDIWLSENLTMLEKVILMEIDSLDNEEHCTAGNEYLAQFCQCSEWKVSTAIKKLQELGYIETVSFDGRHRKIKSCLLKSQTQTLENPKADSGNSKAINIDNNISNNPIVINNNSEESSSSKEEKATEPIKNKRVSRKDQLTEYVESLTLQPETKDILYKWIFQIGLKGNVTVDQLRDKLKDIWTVHNDENLVRQSINQSYLSNWFSFYPVKQAQTNSQVSKPTPTVKPTATPEKSSSAPIEAITPSAELLAQIRKEVREKYERKINYEERY